MSIIEWFAKKEKNAETASKLEIPGDLWVKCYKCNGILYLKNLETDFKVCNKCGHHFRITPEERIKYTFDLNSFQEIDANLCPTDFLEFCDTEKYEDRIKKSQKKTNRNDAVVTGTAKINKKPIVAAIMDFGFMGGSMGSVVGEKITRAIELALEKKYPLLIFTASGGARMQEGITSLMQMAKTSAALSKLEKAAVPYITILCDPTTGGTSASFAMLGDVIIAEPGAFISFAGPRVIAQTIKQKIPQGFQRAEFLLEHGMCDMIVKRSELKETISSIIQILSTNKTKTNTKQTSTK